MRFDILLAQYLYQKKILNLPGIGTFEADNSIYPSDDHERPKGSLTGITFKNTVVAKADDDLIDYIKEQTGKMRPLAISDLESYLTLGKQFLYIGKPFYLEGIGTLSFAKKGFDFSPGEYVTTKLDDPNLERSEGKKKALVEEDRLAHESTNNAIKKFFLAMCIIAGIALVSWAGYYFYNRYGTQSSSVLVQGDTATKSEPDTSTAMMVDSLLTGKATDDPATTATAEAAQTAATLAPAGSFKYIAEVTQDRARAFTRLKQLKSYGQDILMESPDSVTFRLYYFIESSPSDTTRVKDSVNRAYYGSGSGMRVKIQR
ncbi:MAG: hypothetical protein ABI151_01875 [Chitinophagaceae bacterium]